MQSSLVGWVLRIAVAGEFLGHGAFALQGKAQWVGWIERFLSVDAGAAAQVLFAVGVMDVLFALLVLIKPLPWALLWMAFWGFWTALVRPIMGESWWDFVERWANWGAPLALLFLMGWPRSLREWFSARGRNQS
ncbi:MAG: hypothetical protein HYW65_01040 [Candidatus Liptonbacteria bacterium]|nr:hypothetical protein [Candidatus Liptonbacteria bacterium]